MTQDVSRAAPRRIAVFRALQLGDMLCAVPALRALRSAFPAASITLIGLPWAAQFVERFSPLVDDLLVFPGAIGFPEQPETDAGLPAFFAGARARRFDLAIQMHGSGGPANDLLFQLGARHHAGFVQPGEAPRTGWFVDWPDTAREPERYLRLLRHMGLPAHDATLWLPVDAGDHEAADALCAAHAVDADGAVVIHPGAQWPSRRWPAERFAQVADALAAAGARIVLTGTAGEAPLTARVRARMVYPAIDLAGRTSLGAMAALVERVALVVCNDTGISHVAAALRTPSVVIASGSDTRRWAPADAARHRVLADHPACRPCSYRECPFGHPCALAITVWQVVAAAQAQLSRYRPTLSCGPALVTPDASRAHPRPAAGHRP